MDDRQQERKGELEPKARQETKPGPVNATPDFLAGSLGLANGHFNVPIFDEEGKPVVDEQGELVCEQSWAIIALASVLDDKGNNVPVAYLHRTDEEGNVDWSDEAVIDYPVATVLSWQPDEVQKEIKAREAAKDSALVDLTAPAAPNVYQELAATANEVPADTEEVPVPVEVVGEEGAADLGAVINSLDELNNFGLDRAEVAELQLAIPLLIKAGAVSPSQMAHIVEAQKHGAAEVQKVAHKMLQGTKTDLLLVAMRESLSRGIRPDLIAGVLLDRARTGSMLAQTLAANIQKFGPEIQSRIRSAYNHSGTTLAA